MRDFGKKWKQIEGHGLGQLAQNQAFFRETNAAGRWPCELDANNMLPAWQLRGNPEGTVDIIRLETDSLGWFDLGGHGARDVAVGRV